MIGRDEFEAYDKALQASADLAVSYIEEVCRLFDGAALEQAVRASYPQIVRLYGSFAAAAAKEFYDARRASSGVRSDYTAEVFDPDDGWLLSHDAETLKTAAALSSTATQRVMERADETLLRNMERDPAKPRYALVPHAGACGWCRLMASNGFSYHSEARANGARHPHCRCTPVVDFGGSPMLEGYDPDAHRQEYDEARKRAVGKARADWDAMDESQRSAYGGKRRGAYDHFLRNRIASEMNRG